MWTIRLVLKMLINVATVKMKMLIMNVNSVENIFVLHVKFKYSERVYLNSSKPTTLKITLAKPFMINSRLGPGGLQCAQTLFLCVLCPDRTLFVPYHSVLYEYK
jgi:hypothetical protein